MPETYANTVYVIGFNPKRSFNNARSGIRYIQIGKASCVVAAIVNERLPDSACKAKASGHGRRRVTRHNVIIIVANTVATHHYITEIAV